MSTQRLKLLVRVLAFPMFFFFLACPIYASAPNGYTLRYSDEFDGSVLDSTKWSTTFRWGDRTHTDELEYYADDDVTVSGGQLHLKAEQRSLGGKSYTSGMVSSHYKIEQKYGYIEFRAKLAAGKGLWPAFWMLPYNNTALPELDIMENLGDNVGLIYQTYHPSSGPVTTFPGYTGPDFSADFHTFGVEWNPGQIIWTIDGAETFRHENINVSNVPMYMLANLAIGGAWAGSPDGSTHFPATVDIDYVRLYKKNDLMSELFNLTHDVGDLSEYSYTSTNNGHLSVSVASALASSSYGLQMQISDSNTQFAEYDFGPIASNQIRYRFYFNTNSIVMGNNTLIMFQELQNKIGVIEAIYLHYLTVGGYDIESEEYDNGGWASGMPAQSITNGSHYIEVHVEKATSIGASDGRVRIWIDGTLRYTSSNLANYSLFPTPVSAQPALRMVNGVSYLTGTPNGTIYIDEIQANDNGSLIGPVQTQAALSPSSLLQYLDDASTLIASGGNINGSTVVLKFSMYSLNASDTLTPQVEIKPFGTAFTDTVSFSGTPLSYAGVARTGSVSIPNLVANSGYHWQARVSNSAGQSAWISFGSGTEDFRINPVTTPIQTQVPSRSFPSPEPRSCGDTKPTGMVDLFQIDRKGKTATLYFTPVSNNVHRYNVIFGYKDGDEKFGGVGLESNNLTHGVQSVTIGYLDPNRAYSFHVLPTNGCAVGEWSNWMSAKPIQNSNFMQKFFRYTSRR